MEQLEWRDHHRIHVLTPLNINNYPKNNIGIWRSTIVLNEASRYEHGARSLGSSPDSTCYQLT